MRGVELLHPETRKKADKLVELAAKQGLAVKITDTWRTEAEQNALFKQGSITTMLKYPYSVHSWGHAFDFCRNDGAGAYNDADGFFTKVGVIGESLGQEWGGRWTSPVDKPHFQDRAFLMGSVSASKLVAKYGTPEAYKKTWPTEQPKEDDEVVEDLKIIIDGNETVIKGIFKDGVNYPNMRELAKVLGVDVGYDANKQVPVITTGKSSYG